MSSLVLGLELRIEPFKVRLIKVINNILDLYKNNKLKFFLALIPVVLLLVLSLVIPGIRSWLAYSIQRTIEKAKKKDEDLKKQVKEQNDKANEHLAKANAAANQRAEIEDDADWHKK